MRSLLPSVMRPKSMATVVDVLDAPARPMSSMPSEARVITASVVSGSISEIEPTNVVLPTAKPPATTILTGIGTFACGALAAAGCGNAGSGGRSEGLESIEHPFEQLDVGLFGVRAAAALEEAGGDQVAHQHPGRTDDDVEVGRDLGQRDGVGRQDEDATLLQA